METKIKGRKKNLYKGQQVIKEVYNHNVKTPLVEPHCNCEGCYSWLGKPVPVVVQYGQGNMQVTRLAKDRETCDFCGHYVLWQEEGNYGRKNQNRVSNNYTV